MSDVLEINDLEQLADHQLLWSALLRQTQGGSFFHSYPWLEVYWRHFARPATSSIRQGPPQKLRVLIVYSGGRAVGILPLVVRTDATRFGPLRRLTYPLHGWGGFYGPLGENPTATLLAGMRHIGRTPRDWDLIDLPWVARDTSDRGRTRRAMQQAGLYPHEVPYETSALVDCCQPWEDYWASRKTRFRANMRRSAKKLGTAGQLRFLRYRPAGSLYGDDDPRWDLWQACLDVAAASWQTHSTSGTTLTHEAVQAFLADMHERAAQCGTLDVNLLYLDDRPIAFGYNYHYNGYVFGLRRGHDPHLGRDGAGHLLLQYVLEDSIRGDDVTFDLGPKHLESKRPWYSRLERSYRYLHYPAAAPKAQLVRMGQWLKTWRAADAIG